MTYTSALLDSKQDTKSFDSAIAERKHIFLHHEKVAADFSELPKSWNYNFVFYSLAYLNCHQLLSVWEELDTKKHSCTAGEVH